MDTFEYEGFISGMATASIRIIPATKKHPIIIVVGELPDNTNTSITNRAERAYYLAWLKANRPVDCLFVEHYHETGTYDRVSFLRRDDLLELEDSRMPQGVMAKQFRNPLWQMLDDNEKAWLEPEQTEETQS